MRKMAISLKEQLINSEHMKDYKETEITQLINILRQFKLVMMVLYLMLRKKYYTPSASVC